MDTTHYMLASQLQTALTTKGAAVRGGNGRDDPYAAIDAAIRGARNALFRFMTVIASVSVGLAAIGYAGEGGAGVLVAALGWTPFG
ncbi:hypothetical protein [Bauldia litoralis]|uniref:Uncharacterized protein n=1 Tax=Bauldia litoralis TaxID=665467 RepID=A0A1G6DU61_9HYPH|nr:hypothetical protein [Bauldia litoralis]SDB48737.1 hypothetical protein SAMN02982931_03785 [Bauldia litoralis]